MARNAFESDFRSSKMVASSHFVNLTKKLKLRIDLKWREMWSTAIFGHPKWPPAAILWKKKSKLRIDLKWREMRSKVNSVIQNGRWQPFCEQKVAYWFQMSRNVIEGDFRSSKMAAGSHFVNKFKKIKIEYWSEMARNAIESDFRSSKMAAGRHFVRKKKLRIDLKWREMR